MSYAEAMACTVSAQEARREIELHGADWLEFVAECGLHAEYSGSDVLAFLGY